MGIVLGLILITVFLFFPVTTYVLFWYETANSAYRDELARISGGKSVSWIVRGIISSILSHGVMVACYPLGFIGKLWRPEPGKRGSSPPIILIHGLYHNPSAWIRFRGTLNRAGYERVYAFHYNSWRHDFHEISGQLNEWITRISSDFPGESVMMVGHSLGGLLAKAYAGRNDPSDGPGVRAIVTLGTPFGGSKAVVFAMGRLANGLNQGSDLIQELEGMHVPSSVSCTAFRSPVDNLVLPAASLTPPSGWKEDVTDPVCHVAMPYHGPTNRRVLRHIDAIVSAPGTDTSQGRPVE